MPLTAYAPLDPYPYKRDAETRLFSREIPAGSYVFVQDVDGRVWVLPNGPHQHPKVLGRARPAVAAGELTLADAGVVLIVNNCSGTFVCHPDCLFTAVGGLITQGGAVAADAVSRWQF